MRKGGGMRRGERRWRCLRIETILGSCCGGWPLPLRLEDFFSGVRARDEGVVEKVRRAGGGDVGRHCESGERIERVEGWL
jgi:hypothetical protein